MPFNASAPTRSPPPWRLSSSGAVVLHTVILVTFLAASSAPTPLYQLYQHAWGFSSTILTVVFAAYAMALLLALLVMGSLSDHVGRRPVIALALCLEMVAMLSFVLASSAQWLIAARVLQGFATGLATAAGGAALLDLGKERGALINSLSPMIGMAAGALGATALTVFAPAPLRTVYIVLLVVFVVLLALTWFVPETTVRRPGALASLKPVLIVPTQARIPLFSVTPAIVALWMLGGFYLSLMPSLIKAVTDVDTPWLGGLVVAALTLSGAAAVLLARRLSTFANLLAGEVALLAGLAVILTGANRGDNAFLLGGSVIAGFGFGASFLGAMRRVLPLAEPHQRAALIGVFYIAGYLAFSLPTIAAGYLAQKTSLLTAVNAYGAVIAVLALFAIALLVTQARTSMKSANQA